MRQPYVVIIVVHILTARVEVSTLDFLLEEWRVGGPWLDICIVH